MRTGIYVYEEFEDASGEVYKRIKTINQDAIASIVIRNSDNKKRGEYVAIVETVKDYFEVYLRDGKEVFNFLLAIAEDRDVGVVNGKVGNARAFFATLALPEVVKE